MKLLKLIKKINKRRFNSNKGFTPGFTLIEAIMAMALVTIASSMSVCVFTTSSKISNKQYIINSDQNTTMAQAERTLAQSSSTSEGDAFELTPASDGSNGFSSLGNNGKISARCQTIRDTDVQYKIFKLDDGNGTDDVAGSEVE